MYTCTYTVLQSIYCSWESVNIALLQVLFLAFASHGRRHAPFVEAAAAKLIMSVSYVSIDLTDDSPPRVGSAVQLQDATTSSGGVVSPSAPPLPSEEVSHAAPGGRASSPVEGSGLPQQDSLLAQVEAKVRREIFSEVAMMPTTPRFDAQLSVRLQSVRVSARAACVG